MQSTKRAPHAAGHVLAEHRNTVCRWTHSITITGAATTIVDAVTVGVFDTPGTDEIDGVSGPARHGHERGGRCGIHNGGTFTHRLGWTATPQPSWGGGLFNEGTAYLIQSVLRNNMAATGGGFSNTGSSRSRQLHDRRQHEHGRSGGVRNDGFAPLDNTNPPTPPGPAPRRHDLLQYSGTSGGWHHTRRSSRS